MSNYQYAASHPQPEELIDYINNRDKRACVVCGKKPLRLPPYCSKHSGVSKGAI